MQSSKPSEESNVNLEQSENQKSLMDAGKTCYIKFELGIKDFGCGISPEKLDNLFINFNNLEEHRKTNPSCRGLGLSICKMIVEQMGGTVKVESEVGVGSTFSIIFKVMCKLPESAELIQNPVAVPIQS